MAAPPPPINFGEHLYADIIHDFPKFVGKFYNIPFTYSGKAGDYTENATSERLLAAVASQEGAIGTAFAARLNQKIVFTVPKKTATFQKTEPPSLFGGGNQFVGIVQDAGEYITDFLGAQNVLTFGSILDPASKPIGDDKRPIWFDVGPGTNVTIPLAEFGFNPEYIENITVGGLRGGALVSALFRIKGKSYDAVKMTEYDGKVLGAKPINNTKIEVSGYFTSIEGANLAQISRRSTGRTPPAEEQLYFNIGKTLGDVMLVASIMPRFQQQMSATGPVDNPNPFYLSAPGTWTKFSPNEPHAGPIPQILVLKTGDILNHTRAVLKNVPSILERQAGAGRIVKQYEFVPTYVDPAAVKAAFISRYTNLIADITNAYNQLKISFGNCLDEGMLKPGYSNFSGSGDVIPESNTVVRARAARIIEQIMVYLDILRDRVLGYYTARATTATTQTEDPDNSKLRDLYEIDLASFKFFVPQTLDVFDTRKSVMKTKIVVAQVPRKGLDRVEAAPLPVGTVIEISMWNTFSMLGQAGMPDDGPGLIYRIIGVTDLGKKFFARIPAPASPVAPVPPAEPVNNAEIKHVVDKITQDTNNLKGAAENAEHQDNPVHIKDINDIVGPLLLKDQPEVSEAMGDVPVELKDDRDNTVGGGGASRKITLHLDLRSELYKMWAPPPPPLSPDEPFVNKTIPQTLFLFLDYLKDLETTTDAGIKYKYFRNKSPLIAFGCAIDVCELASTDYGLVLDVVLLDQLIEDLTIIKYRFKADPAPKTWGQISIPTIASVLIFNAFTCYVNAENAGMFQNSDDKLDEESNEIYDYYRAMEREFLSKTSEHLKATRTRVTRAGSKKTRKIKIKRRAGKTERR